MTTEKQVALWPFDPEIFYHLDFNPYLDLNITFNSEIMLKEANALIDNFVFHRLTNQIKNSDGAGWKSLGLRTYNGDPKNTEYHTSYADNITEANYLNTEFLEKCPATFAFLNQITDIEKCDRIRFMLLEPGAEIKTHRDSQTRNVSLAVNISLNMPDGCEFWTDLNHDGSKNEYSKKVPFSNLGSVILFNNAKYHSLKNNSQTPRLHLIFHGPIKIHDEQLLSLAKKQNEITSRKDLLKKLVIKKNIIGESLDKSIELLKEWNTSGLDQNMFDEVASLIIIDTDKAFALNRITIPSIFPLKYKTVHINDLDTYLIDHLNDLNTKFLMVCAAGTFIKNVHHFILETFTQIQKMQDKNVCIAGHIIDHVGSKTPYFHEQFIFINRKLFLKNKLPPLGKFFGNGQIEFINYDRGNDIHHNYTPEYLLSKRDGELSLNIGEANFGSKLINEVLKLNLKVLNLSSGLRNTKLYSYPSENNHSQHLQILEIIENNFKKAKEDVYFFNNENLKIPSIKSLQPKKIISVASGFKAIKILEQYQANEETHVVYVDFSKNSLNYIQNITSAQSIEMLNKKIELFIKILNPIQYSEGLVEQLTKAIVKDYFDNNEQSFLKYLKLASHASFQHIDLTDNENNFEALINQNEPFIIWISNVFYNNHIFHRYGTHEAFEKYLNLVQSIAKKINTNAYLEIGTNNVLFGTSINNPIGFITDGCTVEVSHDLSHWKKLFN